jgi:hypothetical protein
VHRFFGRVIELSAARGQPEGAPPPPPRASPGRLIVP